MSSLPVDIYSVATVREIDRKAIQDEGITGYTLMTRAGAASISEARRRFPEAQRWQIVCGAGNNAGDGYVVARLAANEGIAVSVVAIVDPAKLQGDAATAYRDFAAEGGVVLPWSGHLDGEADLIVDAMLGSGLQREVDGEFALAVASINAHPANVVALDLPTGLHGDSGAVMGFAVKADLTVTFVGLKAGLFLGDGRDFCGEIAFADLGIPPQCRHNSPAEFRRIDDDQLQRRLMPRRRSEHKGNHGHVLVVGGGPGMPGAVRLCAEGALRGGAGLVSIATDPGHAATIVAARPELMAHGVAAADELHDLLEKADVVAFGPGLGRTPWAQDLFAVLVADERPCVWDADALNWLAEAPARCDHRIITPHPGEAATLLGIPVGEVQSDRRAAIAKLRDLCGGVAVLKGSGTLVSGGSNVPWLCTAGNPGMAAPGMGDVLTGIIAALLAQGLTPVDAAAVGVEVHALAGDRAAQSGERGMLASDLLNEVRGVINP